jgi:hypothetical protein
MHFEQTELLNIALEAEGISSGAPLPVWKSEGFYWCPLHWKQRKVLKTRSIIKTTDGTAKCADANPELFAKHRASRQISIETLLSLPILIAMSDTSPMYSVTRSRRVHRSVSVNQESSLDKSADSSQLSLSLLRIERSSLSLEQGYPRPALCLLEYGGRSILEVRLACGEVDG